MPAVNTGGFQVSAIPRTDFVDPRLLTPNSQILSGIMDGAQGVNKLYQIAQDARMRPIQQQLAQIQLAQAQQEAAMPRIIPGDVVLQDQTRIFPAALDEEGVRTGPTETEYGDLVQISSGQRVGAGGVITPFETRKTVKTAADREAQAAKDAANLEAINALAAQRTTGKTYESQALIDGYNAAVTNGDAQEAAMYKALIDRKAAMPGILPTGTAFQRRVEQLAADAGITMATAESLSKTQEGMQALAQAAVANKAAARSPFGAPQLTAAQNELLHGAQEPEFTDRVGDILSRGSDGKSVPSFATAQEAASAAASGVIKNGQKIIVNGVPGTWTQ